MILSKLQFTNSSVLAGQFLARLQAEGCSGVVQEEIEAALKQHAEHFVNNFTDPGNGELRSFYDRALTLHVTVQESPLNKNINGAIEEIEYVLINQDLDIFVLVTVGAGALEEELFQSCVFDVPYTAVVVENHSSGSKENSSIFVVGPQEVVSRHVVEYMEGRAHLCGFDILPVSRTPNDKESTINQRRVRGFNNVMLNRAMGAKCDVTIGKTIFLNSRRYATPEDSKSSPFTN